MEVLDGTAEKMGSLAVHKLRSGQGGEDPQRSRVDGSLAWRVNLKVNTPGAPLLHYWQRPDGVVEFASVNHHDDLQVREQGAGLRHARGVPQASSSSMPTIVTPSRSARSTRAC